MRHDLFACFENKPKVQKGHQLNFAKTTKDKPKETRKKDRDKKNTNIFKFSNLRCVTLIHIEKHRAITNNLL